MKFLCILSVLFCAVNGFRFRDVISNHIDTSPHSECAGQPNGIRLPHPDCGRFILCDANVGLVLSCRASEPNFDRCSQRCVNDPFVCTITDCNGGGGTPTDPPPITNPPTEPPLTTTTRFIPPTVPACQPICNGGNFPVDTCDCIEKWQCVGTTCQCLDSITCPLTRDECMAEPGCGGENGCEARCDCVDDSCTCNEEVECPFSEAQCSARCGCAVNCNCEGEPRLCTCSEDCLCPSPPNVCPFAPSDCEIRCGCDQRCLCNGNVCTCDPENHCPPNAGFFWNKFWKILN